MSILMFVHMDSKVVLDVDAEVQEQREEDVAQAVVEAEAKLGDVVEVITEVIVIEVVDVAVVVLAVRR